ASCERGACRGLGWNGMPPPASDGGAALTRLVTAPAATAVAAPTAAAATAAAATTAVAAPTAAAAATAAVFARLGFVDGQRAAVNFLAVHGLDGCLGLLVGAHLDEAEPLGAAGVAVHDDLGRLHRAVRLEHRLQVAVADAVGQVAHVQLLAHG